MNETADTFFTLARCLNIASTLGIAILAVPTFSMNLRKKTLSRIEGITQRQSHDGRQSALSDIAKELRQNAETRVSNWRLIDDICLRIGYFLLLGSAIIRIFT
ncbi:hypothetical protein FHS72_002459 [Loktanella ponticola]|uniref:Uncharacterized protein n=1 Tax=Yoonia ponticola TaxID=1524255 RepID=A0A7W9EYL7_9RHOB|nr:hypothetical protein [Yoonia ponticola]MBB5722829.1 hypothetical protein [Yoonia ponticola]